MKKQLIILLVLLMTFISSDLLANKYAVHFKDKTGTPYSINNPGAFLSERSLQRRARLNVSTTIQDLPVNPAYVQLVANAGAQVMFTSRWLNCVLVSCSQAQANQIAQLSCVSKVVYVAPGSYKNEKSRFSNKLESEDNFKPVVNGTKEDYQYGSGYNQINQINGIPVHQQGYTGSGILVAILDAGFDNANNIGAFSRLYNEGRIVLTRDFVIPGGNVYASNTSSHGTNVLSCMGSYLPGQFIGTAPDASFALIRTENDGSEYLIECYNWTIGAELADSLGADEISTSLGYNEFDDASMNYTHADMDGETAISSIGALVATEKGIFVTASAGNSNGESFPWVGTPADVVNVCTVGAINSNGTIASFSSIGPNGAGDPKPNVLALGVNATVISTSGNVSSASGTSFSCPITAGMIACLLQANPNITPDVLLNIIDQTGNRYPDHDDAYGYGIPNYATALQAVLELSDLEYSNIVINDQSGNNDGKLNPGETASVNMNVHNKSDRTLNNVRIYFTCDDSLVTISSDTVNLGNFIAHQSKSYNNLFSISLSENVLPKYVIKIKAYASYNGGMTSKIFNILVYGPLLQYVSFAIANDNNDNGVLEPGETADMYVYVINNGNENINNVSGVLSSPSDLITINSNNKVFGNVNVGVTRYTSYNVTLSSNAPQSNINVPFNLLLSNASDSVTKNISFNYSDQCQLVFNLHDSYGDGWNGAHLLVSFSDGSTSQNYTLNSGNSATYTINVVSGVVVTLTWQSGNYDSECSFDVEYADGTVIYQTSGTPSSGVLYTFTVNCGGVAPSICNAPTDVDAVVNNANIVLSWSIQGEDTPRRYSIYRDSVYIGSSSTMSFTDANLGNGNYCYVVEAIYQSGCVSEQSQEVCAEVVTSSLPGDANNSYTVDVSDIMAVISYMLNENPSPFNFTNADVNNDGMINVYDIVGIVNIIMGK